MAEEQPNFIDVTIAVGRCLITLNQGLRTIIAPILPEYTNNPATLEKLDTAGWAGLQLLIEQDYYYLTL
jgi:hypothetical protein